MKIRNPEILLNVAAFSLICQQEIRKTRSSFPAATPPLPQLQPPRPRRTKATTQTFRIPVRLPLGFPGPTVSRLKNTFSSMAGDDGKKSSISAGDARISDTI